MIRRVRKPHFDVVDALFRVADGVQYGVLLLDGDFDGLHLFGITSLRDVFKDFAHLGIQFVAERKLGELVKVVGGLFNHVEHLLMLFRGLREFFLRFVVHIGVGLDFTHGGRDGRLFLFHLVQNVFRFHESFFHVVDGLFEIGEAPFVDDRQNIGENF